MILLKSDKAKILTVILVFTVSLLAIQLNENDFRFFSDGASTLDMRIHYSPIDVYQLFDALGDPGKLIYIRMLLIDFVFIASFVMLQNMILKYIMGQDLLKTGFRRLTILSYLRGFSDIIENISLLILLKNFPSVMPQLVTFSSFITMLKFLFLALWLISIPLLVIIRMKNNKNRKVKTMNKTIVIYKSTYGTTKSYAELIAQELGADLLECSEVKTSKLTKYDAIVFGGGIYAGQIAGSNLLRNLCKKFQDKSFIVFSVGFTPKSMTNILEKVRTNSLRGIPLQNIRFFHFSGRIDYKKLNLAHRLLLSGKRLSMSIQSKEKLTDENKRFMNQCDKESEFTLDSTKDLIACLKS